MPELPEIESTVRAVGPLVKGATLVDFKLQSSRLVQAGKIDELLHRHVLNTYRRGKYLLMSFSGDATMVLHFAMTGKLVANVIGPHERLFMRFDNGRCLHFSDMRNWAKLWVLPTSQLYLFDPIKKLGPDALEQGVDGRWLFGAIQGHYETIKEFLMEQTNIAGIGNIYANEILYAINVDPARYAAYLSLEECYQLVTAMQTILWHYIEDELEHGWSHANILHQVYGRDGLACPKCGTIFMKDTIAGRGTYWCPHCQK